MKRLATLALLILAALIALSGCGSAAHVIRWDYLPGIGWRAHAADNVCNLDCYDDYSGGEILPACAGCYDANNRPILGCVPGHWIVSSKKAAIDAKINAGWIENHCRRTAYGCACAAAAWTDDQKKAYPACDPRVPGVTP